MQLSSKPRILEIKDCENESLNFFGQDVLFGLAQTNKKLYSKYFYDARGSELFKKITDLKEYYPTRTEYEILDTYKHSLYNYLKSYSFNFVEFGSGDGRKTKVLLKYFHEKDLDFEYFPLDISKSALEDLLINIQSEIPGLKATGLSGEYFEGIKRLAQLNEKPNFILFLGSNIGNFTPKETKRFMLNLWEALSPGDHILIGFDLVKDEKILLNAYNDSYGITAQFNLNLLDRLNEELNADFDTSKFTHYSYYHPEKQVMKSYLLSKEKQVVNIKKLKKKISFEYMEPIFMENSYKYSIKKIKKLGKETGFEILETYQDKNNYFMNVLFKCSK